MTNKKEKPIPKAWRKKLMKAQNLSEVAELFNEAEQYDDFDCCAELRVWCDKNNSAKRAGLEKPIYIFAETETEQLVYRDSEKVWKVEKR